MRHCRCLYSISCPAVIPFLNERQNKYITFFTRPLSNQRTLSEAKVSSFFLSPSVHCAALFPFQMANSQPNNAYPPASVQELSLGDGKTPSEVQVGGVNKKRRVQTDNGRASKPLAVSNAPTQTTAKSNAKSSSDLQNGEWNTGRATPTPAMPAPPIIESPLPNQDIWTDSASQLTPTLEAALQAASTPNLENAQSFDASAEASPLFGHNADQSVLNTPTVGGSTPTAGAGQTPVVGQTLFNPADNGFETVFYNGKESHLGKVVLPQEATKWNVSV